MIIYLARHTESTYNVLHRYNGDPTAEVPLTEHGIKQAQVLAELLKDVDFEAIYISEFARTLQTAEIINASHQKPVRVDARINENRSGTEGQTDAQGLTARHGIDDVWAAHFRGGESLRDVEQRVQQFLHELANSDLQSVLIITHGCIVQCVHKILDNLTPQATMALGMPQGVYEKLKITRQL